MATVLAVQSGTSSREYPLQGPVTIGRAADNAVVLESGEVSRHHALLSPAGGAYTFMDLGSANGSRVRGQPVEPRVPTPVAAGDRIEIGTFVLHVGGNGASGAMPLTPALAAAASSRTLVVPSAPRLEIHDRGNVRVVPLTAELTRIGREAGNDIVIDSNLVSRRHLVISRGTGGFQVADAGATNGIRIGGQRINSKVLAEGDLIEVADQVSIRFRTLVEQPAGAVPRVLQIKGRKELTIGRDASADVRLDHPMVSLRHALLSPPDASGRRLIEDLGSTNGTFVNGLRLQPRDRRPVSPTDLVQVGPIRLVITADTIDHRDHSREIGVIAVGLNQQVNANLNLLQDLSFVFEPQEFVAVVGVSGAGKSTLLGALSGLKPATGGDVLLNGVSLYGNYDAFRTVLGYVPQDDILHKELPVRRALSYSAELRLPDDTTEDERDRVVDGVVRVLGLQERRDTPVGRLSGGQRKRVSIGAELLTQPGLFFLDEATSGLDPGTESQLMKLLRGLADDGHTIVLITHATKNVMLCDQVVFLARGGHLAYFGPPDQALEYFDVPDFDGIYERLESESQPAEWGERYRRSPAYATYVAGRLQSHGQAAMQARMTPHSAAGTPSTASHTSAVRQVAILTRRYFDIVKRDRLGLIILLLLAPILGAVDLVAWKKDVLDPLDGRAPRAMSMLFVSALIPFLVGALSFVREIVKESPIYQRERAVSLGIWPYLLSKLVVALPLALYHGAALFLFKIIAVKFDVSAGDLFAFYITMSLAVFSGVVWALFISALTSKEEQAMMLIIGVIVLQIVFSGGLTPIGNLGPPGIALSGATSTSWSFKALTASADVSSEGCAGDYAECNLPGLKRLGTPQERKLAFDGIDETFGPVLDANVLACWTGMIAIIVVLCGAIYVLQKRKDVL